MSVYLSTLSGGGGVQGPRFSGRGPRSQIFQGGSQVPDFLGGVPSLRFSGGGSQVSDFQGGVPGLRFSGGGLQVSDFWRGGGYQVSVKGKIFDTRFGLIHVQTGKKFFCQRTPPPTRKGKNFWHQIWLDTCSDWEKIFVEGHRPPVKGKIFDTRFGLIHVQTGKKNFCQGTPPPSAIARNCYGYAAGGMPLACTQEDFLVG